MGLNLQARKTCLFRKNKIVPRLVLFVRRMQGLPLQETLIPARRADRVAA